MFKKISLIASFLIIFGTIILNAQQKLSSSNNKAKALYLEAETLIKNRKFDEGISLLEKAVQKDSNFYEAYLKLGNANKLFLNHKKAKENYLKASILQPALPEMVNIYFNLSQYFIDDGELDFAKLYTQKTLTYSKQENLSTKANQLLAQIEFIEKQSKEQSSIKIEKMKEPLNTFFMQSCPRMTSDNESLVFFKRNSPKLSDSEDIMISHNTDNYWGIPEPISDSINTAFNEGMCSISGDGKTLVFTSCRRPDGIENSCDIYICYKNGNQWSSPKNIGTEVNSNSWDSEPSISSDGKTIYFSSDRKGGLGKEDIWVTKLNNDGKWSKAQNLGSIVNSKGREVSPFIFADNKTLFFASDFLPSMGGFDLFYTKQIDSSSFSIPQNIGAPINTQLNDVSLFITADGEKGFYSIEEKEEGLNQYRKSFLYEFSLPENLKKTLPKNIYFKGKVTDEETLKNLKAKIELIDLSNNEVIQKVNSDSIDGKYLLVLTLGKKYCLHISNKKYLFKSLHIDFSSEELSKNQYLDIALSPIKEGKSMVLNNIFFNNNDYKLDAKSKTELTKVAELLKSNEQLKILITGHTDNIGNENDNNTLSQKRANEVMKQLIALDISQNRLTAKGVGSTKPIADNHTEIGKTKNRRIEIKIL